MIKLVFLFGFLRLRVIIGFELFEVCYLFFLNKEMLCNWFWIYLMLSIISEILKIMMKFEIYVKGVDFII